MFRPSADPIPNFLGSILDDLIGEGFTNPAGETLSEVSTDPISVNGKEGDDRITTGQGNNLAAGDMVGAEWSLVDGRWVFDPEAVVISTYGAAHSFDDVITTGQGHDVLLGNGGNDVLISGAGDDILNGGRGNDRAFAGLGDDIVNLEAGNDYAEAGLGDDIVNGGDGNDTIYGDLKGDNLLSDAAQGASSFSRLAESGGWELTDSFGQAMISQSAGTIAGETYTISFQLAANLAGGKTSAKVEVLWNGTVVETVESVTGAFRTFEVDVTSTGDTGNLAFRTVESTSAANYSFDGPIVSYDKQVQLGVANVTVSAFAAGQAKLYQVLDGQLNVFDPQARTYTAVGDGPNFKINAVGFNVEDDLIYGVAKSNGTDALGQVVTSSDIVMIDADGLAYRVGDGFYGDYVGDFDGQGNLWTFHSALNRVSIVDVDQRDAQGNPAIQHIHFPAGMFTDRTYDLAFNAAEGMFYAVVSPRGNGGAGKVVRIDMRDVPEGGQPAFDEIAITGTLYGETMANGMAKGAFGAVFFDGDGNLYYGLNRGDHDLNNSTGADGAIFKVNMDWNAGQAFAEFMSDAPATGSNDGAVDPRSADAFAEIDAEAAVLLREPSLVLVEGGNDKLRGGDGEDLIHGNGGDDDINGGSGNDRLFGDQGNDLISGASGNDLLEGGQGNDKLRGESGQDSLSGGDGTDFLDGGTGEDTLSGGTGTDKLVGGDGADILIGGAGNDHLWGGNWHGDACADTFVFASGTGKDFIHDFETGHDVIDLCAFATDFETVRAASTDQGWATIIDLAQLEGAGATDKLILKSVDLAALGEDNFLF